MTKFLNDFLRHTNSSKINLFDVLYFFQSLTHQNYCNRSNQHNVRPNIWMHTALVEHPFIFFYIFR